PWPPALSDLPLLFHLPPRRLPLSTLFPYTTLFRSFDFRVGNKGFVWSYPEREPGRPRVIRTDIAVLYVGDEAEKQALLLGEPEVDRKSTRLNSSHGSISYAVFCLKKKKSMYRFGAI